MGAVFIYELITGGGLHAIDGAPEPSGSLLHEGMVMLSAIVADFAAIEGMEVTVLRDARLSPLDIAASHQIVVNDSEEERTAFDQAATATDATLVIAPEFAGLHLERTRWAEQAGAALLSPGSDFVAIASNKWHTFQKWREAKVPTVDTFRIVDQASWRHLLELPVITKPVDGAGSEGVLSWNAGKEIDPALWEDETFLIQPKMCGDSISCSALGSDNGLSLLPASIQRLDKDFKYLGGTLPLPSEMNERAHRLMSQAIRTLPPFRGYVGLDMILGLCPEGTNDVAVDLNPRLTSSYVGLRRHLRDNLAQAMLDVVAGRPYQPNAGSSRVDFEVL